MFKLLIAYNFHALLKADFTLVKHFYFSINQQNSVLFLSIKNCRGNFRVSKLANATPQHYFYQDQWRPVGFMLRLIALTLVLTS